MDLARAESDPLPFFVIAQVLRTIAVDWDDRPLGVSVANDTRDAIVPIVHSILDDMLAGEERIEGRLSVLVQTLYTCGYELNKNY